MKKILPNNQAVAHYFANAVQDEGSASNFFFDTIDGQRRLYSYGRHFCIARRLSLDVYAFTTRKYGNSTSKHLAYARSALNGRTLVWCNDPSDSAAANKRAAQLDINIALSEAETVRRIRPETRTAHKASALRHAQNFNAYLAALPVSESADVEPFEITGVDEMREALARDEAKREAAALKRKEAAILEEADYVKAWRNDPTMRTVGMLNHPIALRLAASRGSFNTGGLLPDSGSVGREVIQTSRGAEIPANDARMLWPVLVSVRSGERTPEEAARLVRRLGMYTLTSIAPDGAIVVGCHAIAWSELEMMAVRMGLSDEVTA